jgi:hypothetical protein
MRGIINIILISFICAVTVSSNVFAQAPDTSWTRIFGGYDDDVINSIQQTADSGYILAGYSGEGMYNHDYDFLLIKTDSGGDTVWTRYYGGVLDEIGNAVLQTSDGKYAIAGFTNSYGSGGRDVFVVKSDENGDTLWTATCGGTDDDEGWSIVETIDGGYLVAGTTDSYGAGESDVYLVKFDVGGDTLWTNTIGDTLNEKALSIAPTSDGGYIITGLSGAISSDVYLLKIDANGDSLWSRSIETVHLDVGNYVQQTSDGGYIIAATSCGTTPGDGCVGCLYRTDGNGDTLWIALTGSHWASSVRQTAAGDFLTVGGIYDNIPDPPEYHLSTAKINSAGDTLWTNSYEDADGNSLVLTDDGGFIIAGEHLIYGCYYTLGDVNGSGNYNGLDVTYGVNFFKYGSPLPQCPSCPHSPQWYYCGDVNGSCTYNGLDITYGVAYFKGGPEPVPIPDFPPGGNTDVYLLKFDSR